MQLVFSKEKPSSNPALSFLLSRTQQQTPMCWMRTQQRDGRAGSASGRTSMRRLWPTSTALMCRPFSNFIVLPTPMSPRQRAAPKHLLPPHRSMHQSTPWTPSTALSWPVTIQCWAHRCRSARVLIQSHNCTLGCMCKDRCNVAAINQITIPPIIRHYVNFY